MAETIFFSWQSDRPAAQNRSFIEAALERALRALNSDAEIEEAVRDELVVDKDTQDEPGQPPIVETIFRKIDSSAVFVPDLTFVGERTGGRPSPNPNVLIEYGWALKSLGHSRIMPVMNIAYGEPEGDAMPFDMRHLRNPIRYNLPEGTTTEKKKDERDKLARALQEALKSIFKSKTFQSSKQEEKPEEYDPVAAADRPSRFRHPGIPLGLAHDGWGAPHDVFLMDGPAMWLRVMPSHKQRRTWTTPEIKAAITGGGRALVQFFISGSFSDLRAEDGAGSFVSTNDSGKAETVSFLFEKGEAWAIDTRVMSRIRDRSGGDRRPGLPANELEREFNSVLSNLAGVLGRLGVVPPYKWIAGLEGVRTFGLYYDPPAGKMWVDSGPHGSCVADVVIEEGLLANDHPTPDSLKPFFSKLFSKCDLERPQYLDLLGQKK